MAFEQLLQPAQRTAQGVAEEFAKLWAPYTTRVIADAKRVKRDHHQGYAASQAGWPLHRKWMKELYEARSSMVHRGPRAEFSQNWREWQHLVIAGFVYPFAVKLKLAAAGLYVFKERELGACRALDLLLDSHWGQGWRKDPNGPQFYLSPNTNQFGTECIRKRLQGRQVSMPAVVRSRQCRAMTDQLNSCA